MAKQKPQITSDSIVRKDAKRRYTLGVVYEPDELDTDQEYTDAEEIEKACHDYMRYIQGRIGIAKVGLDVLEKVLDAEQSGDDVQVDVTEITDAIKKRGVNAMHIEDLDECEVVECYIAPTDFKIGKQVVKKGTWLAGIVWSTETFQKIQSGEWTGYSMGGKAERGE